MVTAERTSVQSRAAPAAAAGAGPRERGPRPAPHSGPDHEPHATGTAGLAELAARQLGLFTRAQAIGLSCSDRVLARLCRTGQLERRHRGVYCWTAVPRSAEQAALAACLATKGSMAAGVTAMRLLGFDPGRSGGPVSPAHVVTAVARRQPKGGGIVAHRVRCLRAGDRTTRHGITVTSPIRTLVDSARMVPERVLERFVGHLLATRAVSARQLEVLLNDLNHLPLRSVPGAEQLRSCLERANVKREPDSVAEHRLVMLLRHHQLPDPVLQFRVAAEGRFVARVDAAYPAQRVAVELDGFRWHSDPRTFRSDRRRANRLAEAGWLVLRTTVEELDEGGPDLVRQLRHFLAVGTGSGDGALPASRSPQPGKLQDPQVNPV